MKHLFDLTAAALDLFVILPLVLLLALIKSKPGLRTPELARQLEPPPKTIQRWLKGLKKNNLIVFKGPDKTGGYYVVGEPEE